MLCITHNLMAFSCGGAGAIFPQIGGARIWVAQEGVKKACGNGALQGGRPSNLYSKTRRHVYIGRWTSEREGAVRRQENQPEHQEERSRSGAVGIANAIPLLSNAVRIFLLRVWGLYSNCSSEEISFFTAASFLHSNLLTIFLAWVQS